MILLTLLTPIPSAYRKYLVAQFRKKLIQLGVTDPRAIQAVAKHCARSQKLDELASVQLQHALQEIIRRSVSSSYTGPFAWFWRLAERVSNHFYVFGISTVDADAIDAYGAELRKFFGQFNPSRVVGSPVDPADPFLAFSRLLAMTSFGEAWLAESSNDADGEREQRTIYVFSNFEKCNSIRIAQNRLLVKPRALEGIQQIVKCHGFGKLDGQSWYIEFEHVAGQSVRSWIDTPELERAKVDPNRIIQDVIRGLALAHDKYVYHDHLEPDVLLLSGSESGMQTDVVKIAEYSFGSLAGRSQWTALSGEYRSAHKLPGDASLSEFQKLYHPPEIEGTRPGQKDVYAIGVIWYQLLVGQLERPPYDFAERLRDLKVDHATIQRVARCLAHPDRRYENARELANDLEKPAAAPVPLSAPRPVIIGHYDVSDIVGEYIATLSKEAFPPNSSAETAVGPAGAARSVISV